MRVWEITYYPTDPSTIPPRRCGGLTTIHHIGSLREFIEERLRVIFVVYAQRRPR